MEVTMLKRLISLFQSGLIPKLRDNGNGIIFLILFTWAILDCSVLYSAENRSEAAPVSVTVVEDSPNATRLNIQIEDYSIQQVDLDQGTFDLITVGMEPTISREGWPDLPFIARCVLIPPQSDVRLEIGSVVSRIEQGLNPVIAPREVNGEYEHVGEAAAFQQQEGFWPPEPLALGEPAILRGYRLINFRYYPMQYKRATGEMKFNDRVDFNLVYNGIGENIIAEPESRLSSVYAYRAVAQLVENPPEPPGRDDLQSGSYLYIVPNVNGVANAVAPLIEWRWRQGHRVSVETVQNQPGSGTIANLIDVYYESDDPVEFVALVGDATGAICLNAASGNGDYQYSRMDNDPLPDVAIGRISCDNVGTLERVVNKLVSYESDPYMNNTEWFKHGAVVAGHVGNGMGTVFVAKYVRKELLNIGFTEVRHWYHSGPGADGEIRGNQPFVTDCISWGVSVLHYRAYMNMNGLNRNIIYNMNNTRGRWPAVLAISCATGSFVGGDAHTEVFFKARGGGIGAIGTATASTSPPYNNMMSGGVWKGIYKDKLYAFGWGLNSGKYGLWRAYHGFDGRYSNFMDWNNLMGDPGTHIWTDIPVIVTAEHPDEFPIGSNHFTIRVVEEEEEESVADAVVCLYKEDELHLTHCTNDEGIVEFYIDPEALSEGELMITVTKHDHKAYLAEIDVVEPEYYLGISEWDVDDDENGESNGDDDGDANPGETIELTVTYKNLGNQVPEGDGTIILESLSPWAEVISDPVEFDEAPAVGDSAQALFVVEINPACPDQAHLQLAASIAIGNDEWQSMADVIIEAPRIQVISMQFTGGELNPGDVDLLDITLRNIGHKQLDACTATLIMENDILHAINEEAEYRSIRVNQTRGVNGDRFRVNAHPFTVPGIVVPILMIIETEAGFIDSMYSNVTVGEKGEGDPLGPDDYGYICLDSGDEDWEYAPEYDWIEIDPDENNNDFNGNGIQFRDQGDNQDDSQVIDLPFEFQYYGEVFDEITVCSNGWAAFGDQSELADFRNRRIGQALGPNAQLCVWWDNLVIDNGSVHYYYDRDDGRFIIEWNDVRRLVNRNDRGAHETFQIILYDPEVHPTVTDDGMILFQYKEVTNEGSQAHNDTPFCTIGISNLDDSDGIAYTYWNTYPPGAQRIGNEMSLLFIPQSDFRTGILEGIITDFETGEPIAGAEILTAPRAFWTETDEDGHYIIDNILVGEDYLVAATAQGWNDSTLTGFDIIEDEVLEVNFSLLHPEFTPSVEALENMLIIDETEEMEFSMTNTGNGPLSWRVERHLRGDVDADPWELRRQHMVGEVTGDRRIHGVIFINDHYYVSGANNRNPKLIYVLNRDGQVVGQFEQFNDNDRNYGIRDMAWDGEWIWGSGEETIFAFTPEGELMREFQGPWRPNYNFAWDTDREVLLVSSITSNITVVDREGNAIRVLNRCGFRIYGLAYFPDDPDGYSLYITHKVSNSDVQYIHKMNPDNGDTMFVAALEPEGGGPPLGSFITNELDIYSWVYMGVSNDGENDRIDLWQVDARLDWFELDVETGTLNPDDTQDFVLTLDATGLPPVEFVGDLVFYHNAIGGENSIGVTLEVVAGAGHQDDRVLDLHQGWNLVSLNIIPDEVDVVELMRSLTDAGILLLMKDGEGRFYSPENDFNNIEDGWAVTDGYQMCVTEDAELEVHGVTVAADDPIPLEEGWNMKAYFPREPIDAVTALSNIEEQLIIAKDGVGRFYLPEFEFSNMGDMCECQGYQFKVREDVELVYNIDDNVAAVEPLAVAPEHFVLTIDNCQLSIVNMSVLVLCDIAQAGWEIGVFDKSDNLIGSGRIDMNGRCGISVWGDNSELDNCQLTIDNYLRFRLWNGETEFDGIIDPIIGEPLWSADGLLVGNLQINGALPVEFGIHNTYPNPFNSMVRFSYGLEENGLVKLNIYDLTGRNVATLVENVRPAGNHNIIWNADQFASGLYFARLEQVGRMTSGKLMLVK